MKILLTLSYLGTNFSGYQVQKNARTVQGELNAAARSLFGYDCDITGCSRTDAGVHANMFCAAITKKGESFLETHISADRIPAAMNAHLPTDIAVDRAEWAVEYGTYKTGTRAAGLSFSLQTFVAKLKNGLIGTIILFGLSFVGFVEGENVVQPEGVADGVWAIFCLIPAVGFAIALVILLLFYKLRSDDVQVMASYNNGEISKAEAEEVLASKYGRAGK